MHACSLVAWYVMLLQDFYTLLVHLNGIISSEGLCIAEVLVSIFVWVQLDRSLKELYG